MKETLYNILLLAIIFGMGVFVGNNCSSNTQLNVEQIPIDTTYNRKVIDSIVYNIKEKDTIIYEIKKQIESYEEAITFDNDTSIELFQQLVDE